MKKQNNLMLIIYIISFIFITINISLIYYIFSSGILSGEIYDARCSMYDDIRYRENSNVNGLYFPSEKYYTVWIEDRTFDEIEETDRHEYCHHLVYENPEHFCDI